jgi:hypothetical protein
MRGSVSGTDNPNVSSKQLLNCTHEAELTPFQIHYSENLVVQEIEPETYGFVAGNSDH